MEPFRSFKAMGVPIDRIVSARYQGAVNFLTVEQGGMELVYVLRDHRGDIVVESTAPGGTIFKFWVPAVK